MRTSCCHNVTYCNNIASYCNDVTYCNNRLSYCHNATYCNNIARYYNNVTYCNNRTGYCHNVAYCKNIASDCNNVTYCKRATLDTSWNKAHKVFGSPELLTSVLTALFEGEHILNCLNVTLQIISSYHIQTI